MNFLQFGTLTRLCSKVCFLCQNTLHNVRIRETFKILKLASKISAQKMIKDETNPTILSDEVLMLLVRLLWVWSSDH